MSLLIGYWRDEETDEWCIKRQLCTYRLNGQEALDVAADALAKGDLANAYLILSEPVSDRHPEHIVWLIDFLARYQGVSILKETPWPWLTRGRWVEQNGTDEGYWSYGIWQDRWKEEQRAKMKAHIEKLDNEELWSAEGTYRKDNEELWSVV